MCEVPQRSWRDAVSPARALLAVGSLALGTVGTVLGGLEGLGLIAVASGFLVAAVVLPTVRQVEFGFPVGVKVQTAVQTRAEEFRESFTAHRGDLEICAQLLCDDEEQAARLLEVSWADAVDQWRGPLRRPELRAYVLCVLVHRVGVSRRWLGSSPARLPARASLAQLDWDQRVAVVLHDFARLPHAQVAAILETDPAEIAERLRTARSGAPGRSTTAGDPS